jgi:hypothetical protein
LGIGFDDREPITEFGVGGERGEMSLTEPVQRRHPRVGKMIEDVGPTRRVVRRSIENRAPRREQPHLVANALRKFGGGFLRERHGENARNVVVAGANRRQVADDERRALPDPGPAAIAMDP